MRRPVARPQRYRLAGSPWSGRGARPAALDHQGRTMPHRLSTEWPGAWPQPVPDLPALFPDLPALSPRRLPPPLRRRVEGDRGTRTLRTGRDLQLVGYLLGYPEAVTGCGLP